MHNSLGSKLEAISSLSESLKLANLLWSAYMNLYQMSYQCIQHLKTLK